MSADAGLPEPADANSEICSICGESGHLVCFFVGEELTDAHKEAMAALTGRRLWTEAIGPQENTKCTG